MGFGGVVYATGLLHFMLVYWYVSAGVAALGVAGGYARHVVDNQLGPLSPKGLQSFAVTSYYRGFDMLKSCKRLAIKSKAVVETVGGFAGKNIAVADGNNVPSNVPTNSVP